MSITYTKKAYKRSFLNKIAELNEECFPLEDTDTYCDPDYLEEADLDYITVYHNRKLVGYLIYRECRLHLESVRRGVKEEYRGLGLGKRLAKKFIKVAEEKNKDIYTYVAKHNLASLNSNIRCGYIIDAIQGEWVFIKYKTKKNKKT